LKLQSKIKAPTLCCPKNLSDLKRLLSRVRSDIPSQIPSLTLHITSTHLVPYEQKKLNNLKEFELPNDLLYFSYWFFYTELGGRERLDRIKLGREQYVRSFEMFPRAHMN